MTIGLVALSINKQNYSFNKNTHYLGNYLNLKKNIFLNKFVLLFIT